MSQGAEKEFFNIGVQSPSEFKVEPDQVSTQLKSRRTASEASAKTKANRVVLTRDSGCEFKPVLNNSQKTLVITLENCNHQKESSDLLNGRLLRKTKNKKKDMDKKQLDISDTSRTTSDLERKKLEAELKAAEEIAKLKQCVIEKRLELELASLQDDHNPNVRSPPPPKNELKMFEKSSEKSENGKEAEQNSPTYKNRVQSLPAPPAPTAQADRFSFQSPFSSVLSPQNMSSKEYPKTKSSKNESDSLLRNEFKGFKFSPLSERSSEQKYGRASGLEKPLRDMAFPDKRRFMQTIETPKRPPPQQARLITRKSVPEETNCAPELPVTEAYYTNRIPERNVHRQEDAEEPGCSLGMGSMSNSVSVWKTMMSKLKKKLRKRTRPIQ